MSRNAKRNRTQSETNQKIIVIKGLTQSIRSLLDTRPPFTTQARGQYKMAQNLRKRTLGAKLENQFFFSKNDQICIVQRRIPNTFESRNQNSSSASDNANLAFAYSVQACAVKFFYRSLSRVFSKFHVAPKVRFCRLRAK